MVRAMPIFAAFLAGWLCVAVSVSRGDVIFYRLPTESGTVVTLEGNATVNPGGTVTYSHSRFGKIYLDLASTEIRKAPSIPQQFTRLLGKSGSDADKLMETAQWALRHGLLPQFYSTVDKVLQNNPQHPRAILVKQLKAKMDAPLSDSSRQEAELRKHVGLPEMKIKLSKHFILLHDTSDTITRGKLTRSDYDARFSRENALRRCDNLRAG